MKIGYDEDRWIGCGCNQINYSSIAWTVIISLILLKILNPECVANASAVLITIGDLLAVGNCANCNNSCFRA